MASAPLPDDDPDLLPAPADKGEDIVLGAKKKKPGAAPMFTPPPPTTTVNVGVNPPPPPPPSSFSSSSSYSSGGFGSSHNSGPSRPMNEQEFELAKLQLEAEKEKQSDNWVKAYWRPAMGWLYMVICFMDFVGFPLIHIFLPVIGQIFGIPMGYVPWKSLTLENGGLVHMAFGAILGVAAWTRGQEKLQGKA